MGFINLAVIVGALGYFVDIFDLFLFSTVRVSSLESLNVPKAIALDVSVYLLNCQMVGLLIGGLMWGVLGDRKGRKTILFGSILLYSIANLLNFWVMTVPQYAALRFLAGLGLAGELGAAITLVSESIGQKDRGYGTMIVASFGLLGAVAAALVADWLPWRAAYVVGGSLGLVLLVLRIRLGESGLYQNLKTQDIPRGRLKMLLSPRTRLLKYVQCILVGVPVYFVVGILITFSPEFAKALSINGTVSAANAVLYCYLGSAAGDFLCGFISQRMQNRKKVISISLWLNLALIIAFCMSHESSSRIFYLSCGLLGFTTGFWAVLITMAAEHFGTNLRATITTSVPNFIRGSTIPLTLSFKVLKGMIGVVPSALLIGTIVTIVAQVSLKYLRETYEQDLNFLEAA
jgi:MFS transporter, putative metabolite:H+ symporter